MALVVGEKAMPCAEAVKLRQAYLTPHTVSISWCMERMACHEVETYLP
jgi:hypothetical protein